MKAILVSVHGHGIPDEVMPVAGEAGLRELEDEVMGPVEVLDMVIVDEDFEATYTLAEGQFCVCDGCGRCFHEGVEMVVDLDAVATLCPECAEDESQSGPVPAGKWATPEYMGQHPYWH